MAIDKPIGIEDKHGFHYQVLIRHNPDYGFSTALYKGSIIAQRDAYKLYRPYSDDDREQEIYDESLSEWINQLETDLIAMCKEYFNNNF